jgi:hypothetical protein
LRKLVISLLLVALMIASVGAISIQSSRGLPENVKVVNYSWYTYPVQDVGSGDLIVVGEVQNIGTTIIDHITLEGTAFTQDGPQGLTFTALRVSYLKPGEKAPFYLDFYSENSYSGNMLWETKVDHVEFRVAYAGDTTTEQFPGLVVSESTATKIPGGPYMISGTVKNIGDQTSPNFIYTVATFYNSSGTVVAVNMTGAPVSIKALAPGESFKFESTPIAYNLIGSEIANYSVVVQSENRDIPSTSPSSPSPTSSTSQTPINSATNSPSNSAQPTQTEGSGQKGISLELIYVLIGIVVVLVLVVVGLFLRRRK